MRVETEEIVTFSLDKVRTKIPATFLNENVRLQILGQVEDQTYKKFRAPGHVRFQRVVDCKMWREQENVSTPDSDRGRLITPLRVRHNREKL